MLNSALKRLTLAVSVTLAVTGCATVGSDFAAPKNVADASFRHLPQAGASEAHLPAQWWTVFNDETLNRLEQTALRDNPSVKAAAQRLVVALEQAGLSRANQQPSLSVSTSVSNSRTSAETSQGLALGGRSIKGNNYTVGASMSYEVDLLGRVRRLVEASDAQALAAEADRDGVLLMLSSQLATNYWQLRGLDAEMAILNGALDTRRETEELVTARFNAGLSNELDVSRARIERANAQADLHEVQRQRNLLEHSLATLVGASPSALLTAPNANAAVLPQPPAIPVGLPASLLSQRPDLAGSVANLRAANAQIGVAEGAFYPSLSLTSNFGYASESLKELGKGGSRQFSVGPLALSLPIFDGGRNKANLAISKARYEEAIANHETKLLTALREVEDALSDAQERQLQGEVQSASQVAAARGYLVARARYERGVSTYLDVTDAQRSALAADRAAVQINTQRLLAAVSVARALGAGWQPSAQLASVAQNGAIKPLAK
ncbi:efflux transporter outer membrane subunit [Duganella sp. BJB488]|uniref:efflux transporter outer membrane subunit n=1 Tax=unclassified Duganella TaxID=2636909 RepID=UPI000E356822|nr:MULTISPECIES: efflux transporter outer membrane subunit [unclassified Duganella]RFP26013.1 efflux transporter outer membrane subunit [Duganella sp. BJB489]RFP28246.1 efflux transporter outer membrane subunit [Duganella sp. BJB488]RFP36943.1 efflux transporter outer membrane subunit [Duganella sp. BJB480]